MAEALTVLSFSCMFFPGFTQAAGNTRFHPHLLMEMSAVITTSVSEKLLLSSSSQTVQAISQSTIMNYQKVH